MSNLLIVNTLLHQLTNIEISRGILTLREKDGTKRFFSEFTEPFTIFIKNKKLFERTVGNKQISIGVIEMKVFNPNDILKISKKGKSVYIKRHIM